MALSMAPGAGKTLAPARLPPKPVTDDKESEKKKQDCYVFAPVTPRKDVISPTLAQDSQNVAASPPATNGGTRSSDSPDGISDSIIPDDYEQATRFSSPIASFFANQQATYFSHQDLVEWVFSHPDNTLPYIPYTYANQSSLENMFTMLHSPPVSACGRDSM